MIKQVNKKNILLIFAIILLFIIALSNNTLVYANAKDTTITVIGYGTIEAKADTAEIYGTIECVDTKENIASEMCQSVINELNEILKTYENTSIVWSYNSASPIEYYIQPRDVYMAYANYRIKINDISLINSVTSSIDKITKARVDGIQFMANNTSNYVDAMKQAIAKANAKVSSIYSQDVTLIEIEEQDTYYDCSIYISKDNLDVDKIPVIEVKAKIEATYLIG